MKNTVIKTGEAKKSILPANKGLDLAFAFFISIALLFLAALSTIAKSTETFSSIAILDEVIINKIYLIRGQKVMIDSDLAELYEVSTGNLNKAVSRNIKRFPDDFMFQLTKDEYDSLKFQLGILKRGKHSKYMPYAFRREGIAMLSGILHSYRAIMINIRIMRAFRKMEDMQLAQKDILKKLEKIETTLLKHDNRIVKKEEDIQRIFIVLKQLLSPPKTPRKKIDFKSFSKK